MCAKKQYCSPEERYRHKLNMLEPGSRMLAAAGILLGVGAALYWAGWLRAAWVAFGLAGLLLALLGVLVAIELHQDRVMNELAAEEARREVSGQTSEVLRDFAVFGPAAPPEPRGSELPCLIRVRGAFSGHTEQKKRAGRSLEENPARLRGLKEEM